MDVGQAKEQLEQLYKYHLHEQRDDLKHILDSTKDISTAHDALFSKISRCEAQQAQISDLHEQTLLVKRKLLALRMKRVKEQALEDTLRIQDVQDRRIILELVTFINSTRPPPSPAASGPISRRQRLKEVGPTEEEYHGRVTHAIPETVNTDIEHATEQAHTLAIDERRALLSQLQHGRVRLIDSVEATTTDQLADMRELLDVLANSTKRVMNMS